MEHELGITGKSIERWIKGKRPLPTKWEAPLREILFPMVDEQNELHQELYQFDKVVVLEECQILNRFKSYHHNLLERQHFPQRLTQNADVVYLKFHNRNGLISYRTIFSRY